MRSPKHELFKFFLDRYVKQISSDWTQPPFTKLSSYTTCNPCINNPEQYFPRFSWAFSVSSFVLPPNNLNFLLTNYQKAWLIYYPARAVTMHTALGHISHPITSETRGHFSEVLRANRPTKTTSQFPVYRIYIAHHRIIGLTPKASQWVKTFF